MIQIVSCFSMFVCFAARICAFSVLYLASQLIRLMLKTMIDDWFIFFLVIFYRFKPRITDRLLFSVFSSRSLPLSYKLSSTSKRPICHVYAPAYIAFIREKKAILVALFIFILCHFCGVSLICLHILAYSGNAFSYLEHQSFFLILSALWVTSLFV